MKNLKVALLQFLPEKTLEGNRQKGLEFCRKAKDIGADICIISRNVECWLGK